MAMPEEVPILTADDMCVGPYRDGERGCLLCHYSDTFEASNVEEDSAINLAMRKAWGDMRAKPVSYRFGGFGTDDCDSRRISRTRVARVWNRAMGYLGYVVGNPECTARGTLRKVRK